MLFLEKIADRVRVTTVFSTMHATIGLLICFVAYIGLLQRTLMTYLELWTNSYGVFGL
jgi:hypothetical protein